MKTNKEILNIVFGEDLPDLTRKEREAAEKVLNWLKLASTPEDVKSKTQKIITAADETLMEIYGLHLSDLENKGRKVPYVDYRKWCMIEMSNGNSLTQSEVAAIVKRDRSTISSAKGAVRNLCSVDQKYREEHDLFVKKFNQKLLCETTMSLFQ